MTIPRAKLDRWDYAEHAHYVRKSLRSAGYDPYDTAHDVVYYWNYFCPLTTGAEKCQSSFTA